MRRIGDLQDGSITVGYGQHGGTDVARDSLQEINDVIDTLGELWRTAADAAPGCDLSGIVACELHGLAGINIGVIRLPETTLESADSGLIAWLNHLQATVAGARERIRAGAKGEGLLALDTVSLALTTYSATRRLRMHAIGEWTRLAHDGDAVHERWPVRRHREVYSTPHLPRFECRWIEDWLLAGRNPLTVLDVELLQALGITHVLELREEKEWWRPRFGTEAVEALEGWDRLHLPVVDTHAPSPEQFEAACAFLSSVEREPGARVYVHCRAGRERTASILTAYYARRSGRPWQEMLRQLRRRRPEFGLWPEQEAAVRDWTGGLR
jgi:atypical dual specificity phosphatase